MAIMNKIPKTGERVLPDQIETLEEYLLYLRHLFAYEFASYQLLEDFHVLEIGCGDGYGTRLLSQNVMKVIGLDIDQDIIDHALKKNGSKKCLFEAYDGEKIPYDDNTFDAVITFQVIEHVFGDIHFVSEIHRVLKKGSKLILSTPNGENRLLNGKSPWNRFHVREYSTRSLNDLLSKFFIKTSMFGICANYEVEKIEKERIKQIAMISSFDPFNVRKIVPERFKSMLIRFLKKITRRYTEYRDASDLHRKYSVNDYYVDMNDIGNSLDILAVCIK